MDLLETIVDLLATHEQPATYGAVAGVVGRPLESLMSDLPRDPKHSWVVNKITRRPTGCEIGEVGSEFADALVRRGVIETPEELDEWLGRFSPTLPPAGETSSPGWLNELIGSCAGEPAFERMVEYGRRFRESDLEPQESDNRV